MQPTLSLILQRAWRASEPLVTGAVRLVPSPLKLVMFRTLAELLRVRLVKVDGEFGEFEGDPRDLAVITEYMRTGTYSPFLVRTLLSRFEAAGGGTFVDVGANIGFTTVPMAMSGIVECHAFEPDPRNFERLRNNTRGVADHVHLYETVLFDKDAEVEFEISDWNHGDHRVRVGAGSRGAFGEQHRKVIRRSARRLDDVLDIEAIRRPLIVKIDTQGAEANILRGGPRIAGSADILSLEFCPYLIRRMGEHENTLIDFVAAHFTDGVIANWHRHEQHIEWMPVDRLVERLREFSRSTNSTRHLDLLLTSSGVQSRPAEQQSSLAVG